MNLLLLTDEDFLPDGTVRVTGRRAAHARQVLRLAAGERIRVGQLNGRTGEGRVISASDDEMLLEVSLTADPPAQPVGVRSLRVEVFAPFVLGWLQAQHVRVAP